MAADRATRLAPARIERLGEQSFATGFPELNALLADFVERVSSILADDLVGAYLVGSFALGGGDMASDCDFIVVTENRVDGEQERALRALHDEIPPRDGYWPQNLEGVVRAQGGARDARLARR